MSAIYIPVPDVVPSPIFIAPKYFIELPVFAVSSLPTKIPIPFAPVVIGAFISYLFVVVPCLSAYIPIAYFALVVPASTESPTFMDFV